MNFKTIMMMGLLIANVYGQDFVDVEEGQSDSHNLQMHLSQDASNNEGNYSKYIHEVFLNMRELGVSYCAYLSENRTLILQEVYSISKEIFIGVMVERLSRAP